MEKIYPEECLKKLFPNYAFYEKRGISQSVQEMYKCGLASAGRMYRRIVFPIYNLDKQICGFSGRKIDEDKGVPKWKHIGSKNNWVYPTCIPDFPEINEETYFTSVTSGISSNVPTILISNISASNERTFLDFFKFLKFSSSFSTYFSKAV